MKKISKSAEIIHFGKHYLLSDMPNMPELKLTEVEEKIMKARLSKNSLIQIPTEELQETINEMLLKICAISGLGLPKDELVSAILKAELIGFILDFGYKLLNEDEIILAFRLNAQGAARFGDGTYMPVIEIFGEHLNVHYCAKVLSNYMILRNAFESKMKNIIDGY